MSNVCICLVYFIYFISVIDGLSLRRLRAYVEKEWPRPRFEHVEYSPVNANYHRFRDALPEKQWFLPLCGDGKIDKIEDYEQWLPTSNAENADMVFMGNEVCDDGNRLDGDGCSADCSDLDLFADPCELSLAHNDTILDSIDDVAMDEEITGNVYVYSEHTQKIYSFPHASIRLDWSVTLSHSVIAMHYFKNVVYAVTRAFAIVKISTQTKNIDSVTSINLDTKLDPSLLQAKFAAMLDSGGAVCLIRYNDSIQIYTDNNTQNIMNMSASNNLTRFGEWWQDDGRYPVDLRQVRTETNNEFRKIRFYMGKFRIISYDQYKQQLDFSMNILQNSEQIKNAYHTIFDFLTWSILNSGTQNQHASIEYKVKVYNSTMNATLQTFLKSFLFDAHNGNIMRPKQLLANTLFFYESRSFLRSYLLWNSSFPPSRQVPNTLGYSLGIRNFETAIQRRLDVWRDTKSKNDTVPALLSVLTTDTEYTFLKPKRYTHVFRKSWLEEIDDILDDALIDTDENNSLDFTVQQNSRTLSLLDNKTKDLVYNMFYQSSKKHISIEFLAVNPQSKSIWILQNKKLHFITKKGVLVKNPVSGLCLPLEFLPCIACHWSSSDFKSCVPCQNKPQDPNSADQNKWSIQCKSCSNSKQISRRLLQSQDKQSPQNAVGFSIQSNILTMAQIEEYFKNSSYFWNQSITFKLAAGTVNIVDIIVENPVNSLEALREIQYILTQNSNTMTVVSAPVLNYYEASLFASNPQSNTSNPPKEDHDMLYIGIGAGVGGTILVIIVIVLAYYCCMKKKNQDIPYSSLSSHSHPK